MVKTGHKKFVKKEKSRVKLRKSYKTILPKGQNVTNTEFKVKKIIVREQLKNRTDNEILSSQRKLSIKELLSRLKHNNSAVKQDGLSGLVEIVTVNPISVIRSHFSSILDTISPLMLEISGNVRKASVKLLSAMFSQVTEDELSPLFEIVVRYLACAMSHLDCGVREDALLIIDVLLEQCPQLTAQYKTLLPYFLDMISSQTRSSQQSRQLTVDLDSRTTTTIYRMKVFSRLRLMLLSMANSYKNKSKTTDNCQIIHVTSSTYHTPLFSSTGFDQNQFVYDRKLTATDTSDNVQSYCELLMPLLIETFVEVVSDKTCSGSEIVVEAVALLQCIADIILNVIHILQQVDSSGASVTWFRQNYSKTIKEHIYKGRFPFTIGNWGSLTNKTAKQRKKDSEEALKLLNSDFDMHCTQQNLSLCLLAFWLNNDSPVILQYVLNCVKSSRSLNSTILLCLEAIAQKQNSNQCMIVTEALIDLSEDSDQFFVVFPYIYKIILNMDMVKLSKKTKIDVWLDRLPTVLCKEDVPCFFVDAVMELARRRIPALQESIDSHIEVILDNLPNLKITKCDHGNNLEQVDNVISESILQHKKDISKLIYWVKDWDEELSLGIGSAIEKEYFGTLNEYIKDIYQLRKTKC